MKLYQYMKNKQFWKRFVSAGIVAGCYSSVCLSASFWLMLRKKFPPKHDDSGKYARQKKAADKAERKAQHEKEVRAKTVI